MKISIYINYKEKEINEGNFGYSFQRNSSPLNAKKRQKIIIKKFSLESIYI